MESNKVDYLIIKSQKSFTRRDDEGIAYVNSDGLFIRDKKEVFYLKRNGRFVKSPDDIFGAIVFTLFIGGIISAIISGLIITGTELSFWLFFIPILSLLYFVLFLIVRYSNEWLLYFMSKEKADDYINTRERINENGIDGEIIERRKITEK